MFSREVISLPAIPPLLGETLAYMFSSNAMLVYAHEGKQVEFDNGFIDVQFRRMLKAERAIKSPASGIVLSSKDCRIGSGWCQILTFSGSKLELDGSRLFDDFCKGFWPMKESVYRYAKPYLKMEASDISEAVDRLRASRCEIREFGRVDDIEAIEKLLAEPEFAVKSDEQIRAALRDLIRK